MSVPIADRSEVRTGFAGLLRGRLLAPNGPAQLVKEYFVQDFGGQSPVVTLASANMKPTSFTRRGAEVWYGVQTLGFVLRGETGTGYDEGDADTVLDLVAKGIMDVVAENQVTTWWKAVTFSQASTILPARIGGWDYWMETHFLNFHVF